MDDTRIDKVLADYEEALRLARAAAILPPADVERFAMSKRYLELRVSINQFMKEWRAMRVMQATRTTAIPSLSHFKDYLNRKNP